MNGESLFFEFGNIDERFVLNSAPGEKKYISKRSVIAVVACLVLSASVILSILIYNVAKKPGIYERAVWAEDVYQNIYIGNDGTDINQREAHLKWASAMSVRYEGYTVSPLLYECLVSAKDGDIFAVNVTDSDLGLYGTEEFERCFSETGIFTAQKDGELYLFLTKSDFLTLELDEANKEKLIFVLALKESFKEK